MAVTPLRGEQTTEAKRLLPEFIARLGACEGQEAGGGASFIPSQAQEAATWDQQQSPRDAQSQVLPLSLTGGGGGAPQQRAQPTRPELSPQHSAQRLTHRRKTCLMGE